MDINDEKTWDESFKKAEEDFKHKGDILDKAFDKLCDKKINDKQYEIIKKEFIKASEKYKELIDKFSVKLKAEDFNPEGIAIKNPIEVEFSIAEEFGYIEIDKYKTIMFNRGDYIIKNSKGEIEVIDKNEFKVNYDVK